MNDAEKLKPIMDGLMTISTRGNDSITMAQCMVALSQYILEQEAKPAEGKEE